MCICVCCLSVLCSLLRCCCRSVLSGVFFFKQKTAYEMRISDWSSDVCSSDLVDRRQGGAVIAVADQLAGDSDTDIVLCFQRAAADVRSEDEIGRASCRERVCQYV